MEKPTRNFVSITQNPPLIFAYLIRGEPRIGTTNSLPQKVARQMVNFGGNFRRAPRSTGFLKPLTFPFSGTGVSR